MRPIIKKFVKNPENELLVINETFDKPFNQIKKLDEFNYVCGDDQFLIKFQLRPYYKNIGCKDYLTEVPNKVYEISWDWLPDTDEDQKRKGNWVKSTTSAFKVIDEFKKDLNPNIIVINETEDTSVIYRGVNFVDKLKNIFNGDFVVCSEYNDELNVNRIYLIKKELTTYGEGMITKMTESCGDVELIKERIYHPRKQNLKGIKLKNFKEQQLKGIIFKDIYLPQSNIR